MKTRVLVAVMILISAAIALRMRLQATHTTASLVEFVPQGALLTVEAPDFATLLNRWSNSAESKGWLASADYKVFTNSRLLGRLSDAQASFEKAAGIPLGFDLLHQVAGRESIFAWYDIGKLEFLYISRISEQQARALSLAQQRNQFQRRHAGNSDFYVSKTGGGDESTVAFAEVPTPAGTMLVLATREDLMANSLQLLAKGAGVTSIQEESWFHDASLVMPEEKVPAALHMVLNLDRIAHDPHFQTYWIQHNVAWMRQFRSAVSDLYPEGQQFREERALVPNEPSTDAVGATNLSSLAEIAPASTGLFRAVSSVTATTAVQAVREKLLGFDLTGTPTSTQAPDPDLTTPSPGSTDDFETRIDSVAPQTESASWQAFASLLHGSGMNAVMTLDSAELPSGNAVWIPIHSAVVIRGAKPWDEAAVTTALQSGLQGSLTTAQLGIGFQIAQVESFKVYTLDGPRRLVFATVESATRGHLLLLSNDEALLESLLQSSAKPHTRALDSATVLAAFNHETQAEPYRRLTSLLDSHVTKDASQPDVPPFFSSDIESLSKTFAAMKSERFSERPTSSALRQTVVYAW